MKLNKKELINFTQIIPQKCRSNRAELLKVGEGKWDTYVRKSFNEVLNNWFSEYFNLIERESKKYVYVEGWNPIPKKLRGKDFFGTAMHPDAALILDGQPLVAIELDHGTKGSQVRNALGKASFSVKLGGFEQALVLFFVDSPKSPVDLGQQDSEKEILQYYKEHLQTSLYIL